MTKTILRDLSEHPVHKTPPVGAPYVLGKWHHDRATWRGYALETRIALKARRTKGNPRRFLILARPRSGTTLLYRLLNQVPNLTCEGEMLHYAVSSPLKYLRNLAQSSRADVYGCKILSYQMLEVQKIDPKPFLEALVEEGVQLIHVQRNTFKQCLSLAAAQGTNDYHIHAGQQKPRRDIILDPKRFEQMVRWNLEMLDYERELLFQFEHKVISYDKGLSNRINHQETINEICKFLGHKSSSVMADLHRMGARNNIENKEALERAVESAGLEAAFKDEF